MLAYCRYQQYRGLGMENLTRRQAEVFAFLESHSAEHGGAPTIQEICEHFGFKSPYSAQQHLRLIEQKGYITRRANCPRSIQFPGHSVGKNKTDSVIVPLIGKIAAGNPLFTLENVEETFELPKRMFRGRDLFALRVQGDSMKGAGIFNGDLAILTSRSDFRNGEIAAVVLDEEATLKRVFQTDDGLRLKAENDDFPDRLISKSAGRSCRVAGILVGTVRSF
jgi:repressor LexA